MWYFFITSIQENVDDMTPAFLHVMRRGKKVSGFMNVGTGEVRNCAGEMEFKRLLVLVLKKLMGR